MKTQYFDDKMRLRSNCNRVHKQESSDAWWLDGDVVTHCGIVSVQAEQGSNNRKGFTRLDFALDGKLHIRTYQKFYSKRGISLLAGRFAQDVIDKYSRNW